MNFKLSFNIIILLVIFLMPVSCQKKSSDKMSTPDKPLYPTKDGVIVNSNPESTKKYPTKDGIVINQNVETTKSINIIPYPSKVEMKEGQFEYSAFDIEVPFSKLNEFTINGLKKYDSGITDTEIDNGIGVISSDYLEIEFIYDKTLSPEEYKINISRSYVTVSAANEIGFQYAFLTLDQILQSKKKGTIQSMTIHDKPRFAYRGMHLDVARHFFGVDDIKKYIDYLAAYKYNTFHWHLTDDQGWRIEIKKYPKLTEIGGYREETLVGHYNDQPQKYDGKKYGGFYTQEQIKEVVTYAAERSITIIPEIEMPGHSLAALAAYPELGCEVKAYETATKWGVFDDVFCPKEETFDFLQNVLDEVIALFPSKFIHIGGDECPKDAWKKSAFCQQFIKDQKLKDEHELQAYFIKRIGKYLNEKHNRIIIGWDEILEGNLTSQTDNIEKPIIMSWRGIEGGIAAAQAQHKAIMTPGSHCYFDHYQSENKGEPTAIGGLTTLSKVYSWGILPPDIPESDKKYILGGQANVWTEYIPSFAQVEYMAYARGLAMSEALWGTNKDFKEFVPRFKYHYEILKSRSTNIANHLDELKPKIYSGNGGPVLFLDDIDRKAVTMTFTPSDKSKAPTSKDITTLDSIRMKESGTYSFDMKNGYYSHQHIEESVKIIYNDHLATHARISLTNKPAPQYAGNGDASIINGIQGSDQKYGGSEWLGFNGDDAIVNLDLGSKKAISSIKTRFFKGEGQWIYLPNEVEIYTSKDGIKYKLIAKNSTITSNSKVADVIFDKGFKTRFVRLVAKNFGAIPDGSQGAGHKSWLFLDEIVLE